MSTTAVQDYDEMREDYPEDWGKAVFGSTMHFTELERLQRHLGEVQTEKWDGELVDDY